MRAIDGDALKDRLQSLAYDDWNQGVTTSWADAYHECVDIVDEQPTIEPEIVRCKDCKHYQFADNRSFGMPVKRCEWTGFEDVDDYDFCSKAERKV